MKVYWDSSAIVFFYARGRMAEIEGVTRPHTLAESFSALTGGGFDLLLPDGTKRHKRLSVGLAAGIIARIQPRLTYVELSSEDIVAALQRKKARGGRVHDLLHAVAAEKAGADELWTLDQHDFEGLGKVPLKYLSDAPRR